MSLPHSPIAYSASGRRISLLNDSPQSSTGDQLACPVPEITYSTTPARNAPPVRAAKRSTCAHCQKTFSTSGHLARHAKIHSGTKAHACPYPGCSKACSRLDNIVQHFRCHLSKQDRNKGNVFTRRAMYDLAERVQSGWESSASALFQSSLYTGFRSPVPILDDGSCKSSPSSSEQPCSEHADPLTSSSTPVSAHTASFFPSFRPREPTVSMPASRDSSLSQSPSPVTAPDDPPHPPKRAPSAHTRPQWVVCSAETDARWKTRCGFEESFVRGRGMSGA